MLPFAFGTEAGLKAEVGEMLLLPSPQPHRTGSLAGRRVPVTALFGRLKPLAMALGPDPETLLKSPRHPP